MTNQNEIMPTAHTIQQAASDPCLLVNGQPVTLRSIPHEYGVTKLTTPAGTMLQPLSTDPSRQWVNVQAFTPQNHVIYGWLPMAATHTLESVGAPITMDLLPTTDYAHNSRQDILDLIAATHKKASDDLRASGRRQRATIWTLTLAAAAAFAGEIFGPGDGSAVVIAALCAFPIWIIWLCLIWSDYNPANNIQKLQQVQLSKRNAAEVIGDGVKSAAQLAVGGAVALSVIGLLASQSKHKRTVYIEHQYRRF